jgi:hypothetical protein
MWSYSRQYPELRTAQRGRLVSGGLISYHFPFVSSPMAKAGQQQKRKQMVSVRSAAVFPGDYRE